MYCTKIVFTHTSLTKLEKDFLFLFYTKHLFVSFYLNLLYCINSVVTKYRNFENIVLFYFV